MTQLIENINPIEIEIEIENEKGRVYKISSPQTEKIYIGSTFKKLKTRLYQHKQAYTRFLNGGKNLGAFDVVKYDDCVIEELESFEGLNRKGLSVFERKWYDIYKNNVCNINIPNRTKRDWEDENRDFLENWKKEYRINNRDKINKFANEYYHNNKEKVINVQRKYQEKNKAKISQYYKDYYLRKKQEKQQQQQQQEPQSQPQEELKLLILSVFLITLDLMYH
jgi:hypothetical protein